MEKGIKKVIKGDVKWRLKITSNDRKKESKTKCKILNKGKILGKKTGGGLYVYQVEIKSTNEIICVTKNELDRAYKEEREPTCMSGRKKHDIDFILEKCLVDNGHALIYIIEVEYKGVLYYYIGKTTDRIQRRMGNRRSSNTDAVIKFMKKSGIKVARAFLHEHVMFDYDKRELPYDYNQRVSDTEKQVTIDYRKKYGKKRVINAETYAMSGIN
jgi:hypothetical protein